LQPDRSLVQLQHVSFPFGLKSRGLCSPSKLQGDWSSGMIPASGAGGREFDSRITPFCTLLPPFLRPREPNERQSCVWGGIEITPGDTVGQPSRTRTKKCFASNEREKDLVRTGTRTQNLLLRRQAPYPLGHTDNYEFCVDHRSCRTRHSSLGVEHSLSKRKVVSSNLACGCSLLFALVFCSVAVGEAARSVM
jgi:hypothetical protein